MIRYFQASRLNLSSQEVWALGLLVIAMATLLTAGFYPPESAAGEVLVSALGITLFFGWIYRVITEGLTLEESYAGFLLRQVRLTGFLCLAYAALYLGSDVIMAILLELSGGRQLSHGGVWVVAVALTYLALQFHKEGRSEHKTVAAGVAAVPGRVTKQDEAHIIAHEAAHALITACVIDLPQDFVVECAKAGSRSTFLGYTRNCFNSRLETQNEAYAFMLVLLAGARGERFTFGALTLGSDSDNQKWEGQAKRYLSNQFAGYYFCNPVNELELNSNCALLRELREEQIRLIDMVLEVNAGIFDAIRARLVVNQRVDGEELNKLLEGVQLPETIARVKNQRREIEETDF